MRQRGAYSRICIVHLLRRASALPGSEFVRAKGDGTMPRDKDRKRVIRSRMKKTGESYTAARAQILSRTNAPAPSRRFADVVDSLARRKR
jgi:hypothetical protein